MLDFCRDMHRILSVSLVLLFIARGISPVVPKIESLKRADEIDVTSETSDPVVTQPQVLEICQCLKIIRDGLDSESPSHEMKRRTTYHPSTVHKMD